MAASDKETVLVVGSTGNIGISAILAALNTGRNVLAVVRNETSAQKIFDYIGKREGITTVTADVLAHDGVLGVVEQVKAGKLPHFQHVFASCGGYLPDYATPLKDITAEQLHRNMSSSFESNFYAYTATVPYLLEQGHADSTWTVCTGAQGDWALAAGPAMTQGPLYSFSTAASRENLKTNVRFNELYTAIRVELDAVAEKNKTNKASDYANIYTLLLDDKSVRSSRVWIRKPEETKQLVHQTKIPSM